MKAEEGEDKHPEQNGVYYEDDCGRLAFEAVDDISAVDEYD